LFVSFVRSKTPKVVSNLVDFFLFGVFFFLSCLLFKLCISTFDSWKLFVIVFGICKCPYFDLHEYEGLKVQLFNLFLCWTAKKKKILWIKSKRNKYILKKKSRKRRIQKKKGGVQYNFYCNFISGLLIFTCNQSFSQSLRVVSFKSLW